VGQEETDAAAGVDRDEADPPGGKRVGLPALAAG
jgi:hypothetical protein